MAPGAIHSEAVTTSCGCRTNQLLPELFLHLTTPAPDKSRSFINLLMPFATEIVMHSQVTSVGTRSYLNLGDVRSLDRDEVPCPRDPSSAVLIIWEFPNFRDWPQIHILTRFWKTIDEGIYRILQGSQKLKDGCGQAIQWTIDRGVTLSNITLMKLQYVCWNTMPKLWKEVQHCSMCDLESTLRWWLRRRSAELGPEASTSPGNYRHE